VLATSLVILPLSASLAMKHAAEADASMMASGDECPCCKPAKLDTCLLMCCHVQAPTVEGFVPWLAAPPEFDVQNTRLAIAVSLRPDPPPPRS
jgi:hypothetical protein